jgi:hypothetical protein
MQAWDPVSCCTVICRYSGCTLRSTWNSLSTTSIRCLQTPYAREDIELRSWCDSKETTRTRSSHTKTPTPATWPLAASNTVYRMKGDVLDSNLRLVARLVRVRRLDRMGDILSGKYMPIRTPLLPVITRRESTGPQLLGQAVVAENDQDDGEMKHRPSMLAVMSSHSVEFASYPKARRSATVISPSRVFTPK